MENRDQPDSVQSEAQESLPLPRPGLASVWMLAFLFAFFAAVVVYMVGYGVVLGVEYAAQGVTEPDPSVLEARMQQHILTPSGLAGIYLVQCLMVLPLIFFAAHFPNQSWQKTLGFHRFGLRSLCTWLMIYAVYFVLQYLISEALQIDPGDFMRSLNGSQHLGAALVLIIGAPLLEELIFRGYLFKAWRHTRLGLSGTLLLTSLLFTLLHLGQYNFSVLAIIFTLSLLLGLAREKSGSIWVPLIIHSLNNGIAAVTVIYFGLL